MTQFHISRRKLLAGLGTVGVASAGAGLGTTAFFSDEEAVDASLEAGRVDLLVDYRATYTTWLDEEQTGALVDGPVVPAPDGDMVYLVGQAPDVRNSDGGALSGPDWAALTRDGLDACTVGDNAFGGLRSQLGEDYLLYDGDEADYLGVDGQPYADGVEPTMFRLVDVKPKDEGEATISLHVCDNRSYLYLTALRDSDTEGTVVEPEGVDDDTEGELDDFVYVELWHDDDCSNTLDEGEDVIFQGSLADLFETAIDRDGNGKGLRLVNDEQNCFAGVTCLGFRWVLPCFPEEFEALPSASANNMAMELVGKYDRFESVDDIDVNLAQTDGVEFGFTFYAEQCRHNMLDTGSLPLDLSTGEAHAAWRIAGVPDGVDDGIVGTVAPETDPHPAYATTSGCGGWIDPYGDDPFTTEAVGEWVYELDFTAPDLPSGAFSLLDISRLGADNSVVLELDGEVIATYDTFDPLDTVPKQFPVDAGSHTLRAVVTNAGGSGANPTAFLVCAQLTA